MALWVIHPEGSAPGAKTYDSPLWDERGLRSLRKDNYESHHEACVAAQFISSGNKFNFIVSEAQNATIGSRTRRSSKGPGALQGLDSPV
jgi:hypothetical protein